MGCAEYTANSIFNKEQSMMNLTGIIDSPARSRVLVFYASFDFCPEIAILRMALQYD